MYSYWASCLEHVELQYYCLLQCNNKRLHCTPALVTVVTSPREGYELLWWACLSVCCVTFALQRVSFIVIPFCLSVCLLVIPRPTAYHDWSITTKFGRQVYTCPRTRVSLFGSLSPILWVPEGKYAKFRLFPTRILATANVTKRAIWLVFLSVCLSVLSHNSKTTPPIFMKFFVHVIAVARASFDSVAIRYVLPVFT